MEKRPKKRKREKQDRESPMPPPQLKRLGKLKDITRGQNGFRPDGASGMSKP